MPSLNDITEAVEYLKVDAIDVNGNVCVAVRNRNSRCKKCADACIADAITVSHNEVNIDSASCVNCGCCIAVCPNRALRAKEPTSASVTEGMFAQVSSEGVTVVACARRAAKHEVDASHFTQVPCLGHLDEIQLLEALAAGATEIILVDGNCATCKYGLANEAIDEIVEQASLFLDVTEASAAITRMSEFPSWIERVAPTSNRGEDRRGLFKQTGSYMRAVATNVVEKTMENRLHPGSGGKPNLRERLVEARTGTLKKFEPSDNYRIIDALEKMGISDGSLQSEFVDTRHFGNVKIEVENCSGCGMCVLFCPTGALRYDEFDVPTDESKRYVEFSASDCTQCGLCVDVCIRRCLALYSKVKLEDVFDLEPVKLEISKPINRTTIEALVNKNQKF